MQSTTTDYTKQYHVSRLHLQIHHDLYKLTGSISLRKGNNGTDILWGNSSRGLTSHSTHYFGDDFYRPDDQTNSVKALKETSWSSKSGLNLNSTGITTSCYNNTTLGNRFYAQRKGPNVTNPICWTCKNCSYKCAADCEHCVTQSSTELFW